MSPEKIKKRKLNERRKAEAEVVKVKVVTKKKKKSKLDAKEKTRHDLGDRVDSAVEDITIEMKNEDVSKEVKSPAKKKKKKSKIGSKIKQSDGNMQLNEIEHENLDRGNQKPDKEKQSKLVMKKKMRKEKERVVLASNEVQAHVNEQDDNVNEIVHDNLDGGNQKPDKEKKNKLLIKKKNNLIMKKKMRREKEHVVLASNEDQVHVNEQDDNAGGIENHGHMKKLSVTGTITKKKKGGRKMKCKKESIHIAQDIKIEESVDEAGKLNVDEILLVDEDYSRGMKKWLTRYRESRPGLNILQQRIDDYISAYEEQQEQERKEREAKLEEEGWTIVRQQKGRKKTTDTESGVTVGSVAQAALADKLSQKKNKETPLNFYRHQKRDAQRNEVMMLQYKFEQDKKRVQQMKAARKFRPY